jgi:hypothetical protein
MSIPRRQIVTDDPSVWRQQQLSGEEFDASMAQLKMMLGHGRISQDQETTKQAWNAQSKAVPLGASTPVASADPVLASVSTAQHHTMAQASRASRHICRGDSARDEDNLATVCNAAPASVSVDRQAENGPMRLAATGSAESAGLGSSLVASSSHRMPIGIREGWPGYDIEDRLRDFRLTPRGNIYAGRWVITPQGIYRTPSRIFRGRKKLRDNLLDDDPSAMNPFWTENISSSNWETEQAMHLP